MAVFFNIVLPILAGISVIALLIFLFRAVTTRSKVTHQAYEVGKVKTRQKAQVNLVRAFFALAFALLFLAMMAIGPRLIALAPAATPTPEPTAVLPTEVPTVPTATATVMPTSAQPTPTSPIPTATATLAPTVTATLAPPTAVVSSGVGVYLRDSASTAAAELEYLPDGTILFVLDGQTDADELSWQQVETETGLVGWVALDFITLNQ